MSLALRYAFGCTRRASRPRRTAAPQCMGREVSYVTAPQLRDLLASAEPPVVVDVRDEDRASGHIRGSVSLPSEQWSDSAAVDRFVAQLASQSAVVFHCMFSQQRGPSCAQLFAARAPASSPTRVLVLHGGWRAWRREYGDDATLTEE